MDNVPKETCSFSHELASGNRGGGQRRKGQSSSPAPNSKAKTDGEGEKLSKESGNGDESSSDKWSKIPCRYSSCNNLLKESLQQGCVSQDSYLRQSFPHEQGKVGSKRTVEFSKGTWHQIKIRERKGPSREIIRKCAPHKRSACAPKFEERSRETSKSMVNIGCVPVAFSLLLVLSALLCLRVIRRVVCMISRESSWRDAVLHV